MKLVLIMIAVFSCQLIQAHPAWGIVIDKNRNIYFADIMHHERGAVWKLTPEGIVTLLLSDFHAHNVSLDANGLLITAHGEENHTMIRINHNDLIDTLAHYLDHSLFFGGNCTYSPNGEILFGIDHHFWSLNENGIKQKISEHYFEWNQSIYADQDGNVYGPDIGTGNGTLVKITRDGTSQIIAQNLITLTNGQFDPHQDVLLGINTDEHGNIYIAETAGRRIIKIQEEHQTMTFFRSSEGWAPSGIDFHGGNAYVLEFGTDGKQGPQITRMDQSGNTKTIFNYENYWSQKNIRNDNKRRRNGQLLIGGIVSMLILIYIIGNRRLI